MRRKGVRARSKEEEGWGELPDLNKVNFSAIWSVFRMEGKASKAAEASFFVCCVCKTFLFRYPTHTKIV